MFMIMITGKCSERTIISPDRQKTLNVNVGLSKATVTFGADGERPCQI